MPSDTSIRKSLVQIRAKIKEYNYKAPWQPPSLKLCRGSGFILADRKIITNAHIVSGEVFIEVRVADSPNWYPAKIENIGHDCDLALLSVDDENFWNNADHLELGNQVDIEDSICVYGFPVGGNELCATKGIVSRIELQHYLHSEIELLDIQIDAAINPGNSGGPALSNDNKVVGITHQGNMMMQNQGYIIPLSVLTHFLSDCELGLYCGFPEISLQTQAMSNSNMRELFGMKDYQTGVRITNIDPFSAAASILYRDDIILSVDGHNVENDGTIRTSDNKRLKFDYLIQQKFLGDTIVFQVLRDDVILTVKVPLTNSCGSTNIYTHDIPNQQPTYYIYGGLLFQPVTKSFNNFVAKQANNGNKLDNLSLDSVKKTNDMIEVVFLTDILNDEINNGYYDYVYNRINRVNGRRVNTIWDIVESIEENKNPYHVIVIGNGVKIVIKNISELKNHEILQKYSIKKDRSDNLTSTAGKNNYFLQFPIGIRKNIYYNARSHYEKNKSIFLPLEKKVYFIASDAKLRGSTCISTLFDIFKKDTNFPLASKIVNDAKQEGFISDISWVRKSNSSIMLVNLNPNKSGIELEEFFLNSLLSKEQGIKIIKEILHKSIGNPYNFNPPDLNTEHRENNFFLSAYNANAKESKPKINKSLNLTRQL